MALTPQVVLEPAAPGVEMRTVRYGGAVHDCILLDALRDTHAARAATAQAAAVPRSALGTG